MNNIMVNLSGLNVTRDDDMELVAGAESVQPPLSLEAPPNVKLLHVLVIRRSHLHRKIKKECFGWLRSRSG